MIEARARPRPDPVRVEVALRIAINALHYAHAALMGGEPGNVFALALGDIEDLTGLMPGEPAPAETRAEIERRVRARAA